MAKAPQFELDRLVAYRDEDVLAEIRRCCALIDSPKVTRRAFDRLARVTSSTLLKRFGGWRDALAAAGLGDRYSGQVVSSKMRTQVGRGLTDEEILAEVRRVAGEVGDTLGAGEFDARSNVISTAVVRARFGTWAKGLRAAGLTPSKHAHRYTDEDFFENLLSVWTHHARPPTYVEMDLPPSIISAGGYYKRFGTWGKAKHAFVERMNAESDDAEEVTQPAEAAPPKKKRAEEDQRGIRIGLRYEILRRDRFRCVLCGASPATDPLCRLHVDHVIPVAAGGKTIAMNLRTTCEPCNLGKASKIE